MTAPYTPHFLGDLLENTATKLPDKEAILFGEISLTWAAFNQKVDHLACAFLAAGVERGDRIGILCTTRPEYLFVYLAAARIGAVLVGFNVQFTPKEVLQLANLTRPKIMTILDTLKGKPTAGALLPTLRDLPYIEHTLVIGTQVPDGETALDDWLLPPSPGLQAALAVRKTTLDPDDGVLIVLTSGSTGVPKGAVLTHRSILTTILVQARQFGVRPDDRILLNKPMSHVGGATNLTLPAIAVGAALIFMDHFNPIRALEIVEHTRVTIFAQVPTMFIMEFNLANFAQYDLSSVRLAVVGGAATPAPVMAQIAAIADTVMTGYGMTETGGYVTFTHPDDSLETIAKTVGRIAPEYELQIVDEQRQPLPVGAVGEVAMRGGCLLKAYYANPQATAEAFSTDGWFYSGDVGYLDQRGYLTLVDRRKEMYISGGFNVYPREIELYLACHPQLAMVAVLGINDPVMGEVGLACMTRVPGGTVTAEVLQDFCKTGLAEYKIPRHFVFVDALPLTPLGKIDKPRLRKELFPNG